MISRDGGWLSVMPSDAGAVCFMYHVWRVTEFQGRAGRRKGNGNWEKRFHRPSPPPRTLDSKADVTSETRVAPPRPAYLLLERISLGVRGQLAISLRSLSRNGKLRCKNEIRRSVNPLTIHQTLRQTPRVIPGCR